MRAYKFIVSVVILLSLNPCAEAKLRVPHDSVKVSQAETTLAPATQISTTPTPAPAPLSTSQATSQSNLQSTPSPTPLPVPMPTLPEARPARVERKPDDKFTAEIKRECERHFPGLIQSEVRAACSSSAVDFTGLGKGLVETRCRLNYGEEPRLVMACLIGASVTNDIAASRDEFKKKLQLCSEYYPVHNEIDAFLQESCLSDHSSVLVPLA
jgi:hypothetical protein